MTPAQMLKLVAEVSIRKAPTIILTNRISDSDLLFQRQSAMLMQALCPACHESIQAMPVTDGKIRFVCRKNPLYHNFVRSENFLTLD